MCLVVVQELEMFFCQTFGEAASRRLFISLGHSSHYFVINGKGQECGADQGWSLKLLQ